MGRQQCTLQVDPGNAQLLDQHLTCAAVEAPLLPADDAYFGAGLGAAISRLLGKSTPSMPEQRSSKWRTTRH